MKPKSTTRRRGKGRAMATRPDERAPRTVRRVVVAILGVAALAAVAALGVAAGDRWPGLDASPFRVAALEVRGLRLLTGEQVLAASGVDVGASLFRVDLDDVARRLEQSVWVRSARVERKPPDRLIVHLQERRRVAWIDWQGEHYGVDAEGVLLPPQRLPAEGIEDLDLPVLSLPALAAGGDTVAVGRALTDSSARVLIAWLDEVERLAPDLAREISQVALLAGSGVQLHLVADELEVRLPREPGDERLAALREVLRRVYRDGPQPDYVDLRFDGQAVVGVDGEPAPAARPGARRPAPVPVEGVGHG